MRRPPFHSCIAQSTFRLLTSWLSYETLSGMKPPTELSEQPERLLRARISPALSAELLRRPTDEELDRFLRVQCRAIRDSYEVPGFQGVIASEAHGADVAATPDLGGTEGGSSSTCS
jgi:hypothetical protein